MYLYHPKLASKSKTPQPRLNGLARFAGAVPLGGMLFFKCGEKADRSPAWRVQDDTIAFSYAGKC